MFITSVSVAWAPPMSDAPLITEEMANAASLRHWGRHDALRLALAVAWGRYGEADALAELATTLAWHASRARIHTVSCRDLAASMLDDELDRLERHHNAVLRRMIDAAEDKLRADYRDMYGAAHAAADIARAEQVPPDLIDKACGIARWRVRRSA